MYLQDALKDGSARFLIEGLTRTSESYEEAIKWLKERYNCPCFSREEHICSIVDEAPIKNGSDKEIRCFYNAVIALSSAKRSKG